MPHSDYKSVARYRNARKEGIYPAFLLFSSGLHCQPERVGRAFGRSIRPGAAALAMWDHWDRERPAGSSPGSSACVLRAKSFSREVDCETSEPSFWTTDCALPHASGFRLVHGRNVTRLDFHLSDVAAGPLRRCAQSVNLLSFGRFTCHLSRLPAFFARKCPGSRQPVTTAVASQSLGLGEDIPPRLVGREVGLTFPSAFCSAFRLLHGCTLIERAIGKIGLDVYAGLR